MSIGNSERRRSGEGMQIYKICFIQYTDRIVNTVGDTVAATGYR